MLKLSLWLVAPAGLIGAGLAIRFVGARGAKRFPTIAALHGVLGALGLGALLAALARGLPDTGMGTAGFGPFAAALLTLALALGLIVRRASRDRRRPAAILVATHASLAVAGVVILMTLVALR